MKEIDKLSDVFDFNTLYRVKGESGLWEPRSGVNASGLLSLRRLLDGKTTIRQIKTIFPLSGVSYVGTTDGLTIEKYTIDDIITHLQEHYSNAETPETDPAKLREVMVPGCDKCDRDAFPASHADQILKWYNHLLEIVNTMNEQPEVQEPVLEVVPEEESKEEVTEPQN